MSFQRKRVIAINPNQNLTKKLKMEIESKPQIMPESAEEEASVPFGTDLHGIDVSNAELTIESMPHGEYNSVGDHNGEDEQQDICLNKKIKMEEMNVGRNIVRMQIFIPESTEIEWKISDDFIRIYCSSKDKKFLKEFGAQNCENFYVDMLADSSKIDKQSIAIHRHHRKSFEMEYRFRPGMANIPEPPPPPPLGFAPTNKINTTKPIGKVSPQAVKEAGYTGLVNVGNTCFMASVLQCLANVPKLRDYFLSEAFRNDINEDNVLGTGGTMANAFHYLLVQLWSGKHVSVKPTRIKDAVTEKAPQFQGYSQHDAQEFSAYILDLLHEDVNIVKKKPFIELAEANGRSDKIVAKEAWDYFKARNNSKMVDLFHGQYKSKLLCPKCHRESITFDPFVYLSVPLPRETRKICVLFFFASLEMRPRRLEISISKTGGTAREIYLQAARLTNKNSSDIKMIMEYKNRINSIIEEKKDLDDISGTDSLILSEIKSDQEELVTIGVSHRKELKYVKPADKCHTCSKSKEELDSSLKRCKKCRAVWYCSKDCQTENWKYHKSDCKVETEFIGTPFMISVPKMMKRNELHTLIQQYAKYSIVYEWDDESIEKMKNYTSDYETPPSSPENPIENGSGPITITQAPFKVIPSTQIGIPDKKNETFAADDSTYDLSDVKFLTVEWLNDEHNLDGKPFLSRVESISSDEIKCDSVESYEDTVTLERCIELFSESEILQENDLWYCTTCKEHVAAAKQISLWRLPKVLVFHLKRFQYKAHQYFSHSVRREKINKLVEYEINDFDMSPFCIDPESACDGLKPNYDLIGVVQHMGSMSFGHYTARIRHPDHPEVWRLADDSHVKDCNPKSAVNENAYLLFYKLKEENVKEESKAVEINDLESSLSNIELKPQSEEE